jgi:hypothetical protein
MREVGKTNFPKDMDVEIAETGDGIYRIAGFDDTLGIRLCSLKRLQFPVVKIHKQIQPFHYML